MVVSAGEDEGGGHHNDNIYEEPVLIRKSDRCGNRHKEARSRHFLGIPFIPTSEIIIGPSIVLWLIRMTPIDVIDGTIPVLQEMLYFLWRGNLRGFAGICGGDLDELDDFDVDNDEK